MRIGPIPPVKVPMMDTKNPKGIKNQSRTLKDRSFFPNRYWKKVLIKNKATIICSQLIFISEKNQAAKKAPKMAEGT